MNRLTVIGFAICLLASCKKDEVTSDNSLPQNISVLVTPQQTDNNYASTNESHYIVRNTKTHLNKLLLFIGGSYSVPKDYNYICDHAATIGLDVISLSYPNEVAAFSLSTSSDAQIFSNYREEICFGNPVSSLVDVNALNSIETRVTKLLVFLKSTYPDQNWGQYLTSVNAVQWSKVIVSGHSQGSGHACYLAKKFLTDRLVMLSGPNDYSTYFGSSASWLAQSSLTPINKYYSLLHTQDEIVPFAYQVANNKAMGLLSATESPTLVDNLSAPYANAHSLSLNIPAISYHNSTVGQNPILPNIWTYMLITP
jgi:hypothetical protein